MKQVTCNKCGWVHVGIALEDAEKEVASFNDMYNELTAAEKERYYSSKCSNITTYEHCVTCGNSYTNFRPSKENDCPNGVTLNVILEN